MNKAWILLITLFAISCGPKPEQVTAAKIALGAAVSIDAYPAGLFFFAKHRETNQRLSKRLRSSAETISLPNGSWDFSVIGWTGDAQQNLFTGTSKCDQILGLNLTGQNTVINFALESNKCNSPRYKGGLASQDIDGFKPIHFNSCTDIKNELTQGASAIPAGMYACTGSSLGKSKSFQVALFEHGLKVDPAINLDPSLATWSKCYSSASSYNVFASGLRLPTGNLEDDVSKLTIDSHLPGKFPVMVKKFEGQNCTGFADNHLFPNGLGGNDYQKGGVAFVSLTTNDRVTLFLDDDMCSGDWGTSASINAGKGIRTGSDEINFICNPQQLFDIDNQDLTAYYGLGRDLYFTGIQSQIIAPTEASPFIGTFDGRGNSIHNLAIDHSSNNPNIGLFGNIGAGAVITDLVFHNFSLIVNGGSPNLNIGGLVGKAVSANNISLDRIQFFNPVINFQPQINDGGNVGTLIGFLDSTGQQNNIRDVHVSGGNVRSHSNAYYAQATGGLIGSILSTGSGYVYVNESSFSGEVFGSTNTGGLVGMASADVATSGQIFIQRSSVGDDTSGLRTIIYYTSSNNSDPSIAANVGGLVGQAIKTEVFNSKSLVELKINSWGASIGGIIGELQAGKVNNCLTDTIINPLTTQEVSMVGGAIGTAGIAVSNCTANSYQHMASIINTSVKLDSNITATVVGGLVGNYLCPPNLSTVLPPLSQLYEYAGGGSIIEADIGLGQGIQSTQNKFRGGVFGIFGQAGQQLNGNTPGSRGIIVKSNIQGQSILGGFAGRVYGDTQIQEIASFSNITNYSNGAGTYSDTGGFVGQHLIESTYSSGGSYKYILNDAIITHTQLGSTTGQHIGELIGLVYDEVIQYTTDESKFINYIDNSMVVVNQNISPSVLLGREFGSSNPTLTYFNYNTPANSFTATTPETWVDSPFNSVGGGLALPSFLHKALLAGGKRSAVELFPINHGTYHSPYLISSCQDFYKVRDDLYLLTRSYQIANDIDFSAAGCQPFVPFGGPLNVTAEIFTGNLKNKNFVLRNINYTSTQAGNELGLIRKSQQAEIGSPEFPLLVDNITININGNNNSFVGSIVGQMSDGQITAKVTNASIISPPIGAGTASGIGGLVGQMTRGNISDSSYQGMIELGGDYNMLGGLVGQVSLSDNSGRVEIRSSNAKISNLKTGFMGSSAGGLVGSVTLATATNLMFQVDRSYVQFDQGDFFPQDVVLPEVAGVTDRYFGGILGGSYLETSAGTISINNTYVDVLGSNLPASSIIGSPLSNIGDSTGYSGSSNIIINGGHSSPSSLFSSSLSQSFAIDHSDAANDLESQGFTQDSITGLLSNFDDY